jgi:HTH-type transcriptional regulator, competence development regulator
LTKDSSFGLYLKHLREKKGLSLNKLAELSNLSHSYLSQIERGNRGVPSPDNLRKLAEHLGVTFGHLMLKAGHIDLSDFIEVENNANSTPTINLSDWIGDDDEELGKGKINLADWIGDIDQTKELTDFLLQSDITYKGQSLTSQDRQRILDMLAILFPDRK